jgi:membrane protease YdiL (CAAX protease family)
VNARRAHTAVTRASLLEFSLAVLAVGIGTMIGVDPLASLAWDPSAVVVGCAAAVPLWIVFAASWASAATPLSRMREVLESVLPRLFHGASPVGLAVVAIAAGIGEECLFRGLIQSGLENRFGPIGGLAAASVIFGLAHPISPTYVVVAAAMGAYLGWLWRWDGNLLVPITTHAVYDFVVLWFLLRPRSVVSGK